MDGEKERLTRAQGKSGEKKVREELEGLSFAEPIMSAAGVGGHADCGRRRIDGEIKGKENEREKRDERPERIRVFFS